MLKPWQCFCLIALLSFTSKAVSQWQDFSYVAMTTPIKLVFWEADKQKAQNISDQVFAEFDRVEQQMSRYIETSELSKINREASKQELKVSDSLFTVLNSAMHISKLSQGAFDISFASVGYMYDYRVKLKPLDADIQKKLPLFHYQNILLDETKQTIRFAKVGTVIDLGGIAKGYAVDQGIAILKKYGISSAHLSAGGDMRLLGDKQGAPWIIGIRNPRDEAKQALILPLSDTAVSTSGDYERYFIDEEGERVHHILSPKTGQSAKGMQSVTIIANEAMLSDGLSTAVFVLGVEKGIELINRLQGIDAILIDELGKIHYSAGLMQPKAN